MTWLLLRRGGRPLIPLGAILEPLGAEFDPAARTRLAQPGRTKIRVVLTIQVVGKEV